MKPVDRQSPDDRWVRMSCRPSPPALDRAPVETEHTGVASQDGRPGTDGGGRKGKTTPKPAPADTDAVDERASTEGGAGRKLTTLAKIERPEGRSNRAPERMEPPDARGAEGAGRGGREQETTTAEKPAAEANGRSRGGRRSGRRVGKRRASLGTDDSRRHVAAQDLAGEPSGGEGFLKQRRQQCAAERADRALHDSAQVGGAVKIAPFTIKDLRQRPARKAPTSSSGCS